MLQEEGRGPITSEEWTDPRSSSVTPERFLEAKGDAAVPCSAPWWLSSFLFYLVFFYETWRPQLEDGFTICISKALACSDSPLPGNASCSFSPKTLTPSLNPAFGVQDASFAAASSHLLLWTTSIPRVGWRSVPWFPDLSAALSSFHCPFPLHVGNASRLGLPRHCLPHPRSGNRSNTTCLTGCGDA